MSATGWGVLYETMTDPTGPRQTLRLERVVRQRFRERDLRLRITVKIDSHLDQCAFRVESWTGREWTLLLTMEPSDLSLLVTNEIGYAREPEAKTAELDRVYTRLLEAAQAVIL